MRPTARRQAVGSYADWLHESLARATDDWPLGRRRRTTSSSGCAPSTASTPTRSSRSANSSWPRTRPRASAAAREIDPTVDEPTVVDRIKRDHPATFEEALEAYRDVMLRARRHLIERDIVTVPVRRADRRHRDARVPAQRHPVRGVFRAAEVRRQSVGDLRRDAFCRPRPERHARAQLAARSATPRSTRRTPATTCSSRSPPCTPR